MGLLFNEAHGFLGGSGAALLQEATHTNADKWAILGRPKGHMYQLVDYCMDIYAEGKGKESGKDREPGRLTLPLLLASQPPGQDIAPEFCRHRTFTQSEDQQIEGKLHSTIIRKKLQRRLGWN